MRKQAVYSQTFQIKGGDFVNAGTVSVQIKKILKEIGLGPDVVYRAAICCYEAEMNVIMYARKAILEFKVSPKEVMIQLTDEGPGIKDIELAMKEGYSTATTQMRELGFGAGMGLPNIRKNSDVFEIASEVSIGTQLTMKIFLN